jgi:hypothetical protein
MNTNTPVIWILKSPLHRLASGSILLITYTGRKSGKTYTVPVNYMRQANELLVTSKRERTWWRSLLGGAPVHIRLVGKDYPGTGLAVTEPTEVLKYLEDYLRQSPQTARYFGIYTAADGSLSATDLALAAKDRVIIRLKLSDSS